MKTTIELLQTVKKIIDSHADKLKNNETATRYSLIDPLLRHLGWDISNPDEVIPEYGIEKKYSDYAIFKIKDKQPFIIIEAKSLHSPLEDKSQIGNYIGNSTARFVIFTDGVKWKLFDFKIHPQDTPDERIVLDINIINEPDNITAMKLFCLSKDNLLSDTPFFLGRQFINAPKLNLLHPTIKQNIVTVLPNKQDKKVKVTFKDFQHKGDGVFFYRDNPSIEINVSDENNSSISKMESKLAAFGLYTQNGKNLYYQFRKNSGTIKHRK